MDAVNAFNHELFSLMESKPPISRAKMISITKSAIKAIKLYKHVVQIVEKFIKKCKPEYKVPGLYVVDSIVRQSRHQFGADKDVFGPRFTKNITGTFENLCLCPTEDRSKIVRVLNLWQKNGVFKIEVIQPLLDMAAGSGSSAGLPPMDNGPDGGASPPSPAREVENHPAVSVNSLPVSVPSLQNSDALAAVAQLFQSSQGQQLQQMLQTFQQPSKPQSPVVENIATAPIQVPPVSVQPSPGLAPCIPHASQPVERKATFDKKILDRFDYDDEPDGGDESKKDETPSVQSVFGFPEGAQQPQQASAAFPQPTNQMQHFQQHLMSMTQDQQVLPPNGQVQGFGRMPVQPYPGLLPPMGQPPSAGPAGFPGSFPPQNDVFSQLLAGQRRQEASVDLDTSTRHQPDSRRSRSRSGSRSPKRRRSRSDSRSRRARHRHSRSRSRERRRHSPRSRSQERRERERERRQAGLPPIKPDTLSVCSTTLWVGQLDKRTQQQDVACLLEEFGQIESINMIPPRGCAYIVMVHRQDAFRALQKLSRGTYKVNQKAIKIAWALNKGIKSEFKQYWVVDLGVTYIPWSKLKTEDLEVFREGGMLDTDTLSPEWRGLQPVLQMPDETSQNGRADVGQTDDPAMPPAQVPVQPTGAAGTVGVPPPGFPGPMTIPPPSFPPGVPPPPGPFMRPGFNPMQMPPGFLPPGAMPPIGSAGPPPPTSAIGLPPVSGSVEDVPGDPAGMGSRVSRDAADAFSPVPGNQVPPGGLPGMSMQNPPGLLGSRPGVMPLQRPPGMPPPHLQRFAMPPPRPGMPPMPPQMVPPRGPPQMVHCEPPPGGFGMPPPPHPMRGPFPPPGPPFMRPRGPEGPPEDHEGRHFRSDRAAPGRERDQDWYSGRRPFGEGRSAERPEGRDRFGSWHEEAEQRAGRDRGRDRRDWRRSPEPDRERERDREREGEERVKRSRDRERSTRWDKDDRLDRLANMGGAPNGHEMLRDSSSSERLADSAKELPQSTADAPSHPAETSSETQEVQSQAAEQSESTES
ncbi:SR-related and CTD-associated factor 4 isoform X2 [Brachyhypopomus gauderio]|uniref:SR-related and CTD-associated factor 4 isoform X2 n=1 Tax=Brachyhypopomus gauderio TaxID=698409 RepID=UPI004043447E